MSLSKYNFKDESVNCCCSAVGIQFVEHEHRRLDRFIGPKMNESEIKYYFKELDFRKLERECDYEQVVAVLW